MTWNPRNHFRLSILARTGAALAGAYVLTALIAILASQLLMLAGMDRTEAVLAATIPSFLLYAGLVCAIFHTRSAKLAWARLAVACAFVAALASLLAQDFPAWQ
ncbi:MAG: hypothetical protein QM681_00160 [Novosphingobium sp.]